MPSPRTLPTLRCASQNAEVETVIRSYVSHSLGLGEIPVKSFLPIDVALDPQEYKPSLRRPSAFAVLRLVTNSNVVGCSTGRSSGSAPLRISSTYVAARRHIVKISTIGHQKPIFRPSSHGADHW